MGLYMTEANDAYCLGGDEAGALLAGAPWRRLVVMGDSIAAGIGDPVKGYLDRGWADRLAAALAAAYLNVGRAGAHAIEVREGQLGRALAFGPDLAVVAAGANDAFRRSFAAPAVEAELERIVSALSDAGSLVVTFGCFDLGRTSFLPPERRAGPGSPNREDHVGSGSRRGPRRHKPASPRPGSGFPSRRRRSASLTGRGARPEH
jgi:hypothetical protein